MKTVTYSINKLDVMHVAHPVGIASLSKNYDDYANHPEWFGGRDLNELKALWLETAVSVACFEVLKRDGLALIQKKEDNFYTFADHEGDCFDPSVNSDISPEELKRQRKRERARFNRQGVWYHTLVVLHEERDSIGGFVGDDFYCSGYDTDFYNQAFDYLTGAGMANYVDELLGRVKEALAASASALF